MAPASLEENLGTEQNRFRRAAGLIDFQNNLEQQIVSCCAHTGIPPFLIAGVGWASLPKEKRSDSPHCGPDNIL
jgi:hypothetical protein